MNARRGSRMLLAARLGDALIAAAFLVERRRGAACNSGRGRHRCAYRCLSACSLSAAQGQDFGTHLLSFRQHGTTLARWLSANHPPLRADVRGMGRAADPCGFPGMLSWDAPRAGNTGLFSTAPHAGNSRRAGQMRHPFGCRWRTRLIVSPSRRSTPDFTRRCREPLSRDCPKPSRHIASAGYLRHEQGSPASC